MVVDVEDMVVLSDFVTSVDVKAFGEDVGPLLEFSLVASPVTAAVGSVECVEGCSSCVVALLLALGLTEDVGRDVGVTVSGDLVELLDVIDCCVSFVDPDRVENVVGG